MKKILETDHVLPGGRSEVITSAVEDMLASNSEFESGVSLDCTKLGRKQRLQAMRHIGDKACKQYARFVEGLGKTGRIVVLIMLDEEPKLETPPLEEGEETSDADTLTLVKGGEAEGEVCAETGSTPVFEAMPIFSEEERVCNPLEEDDDE